MIVRKPNAVRIFELWRLLYCESTPYQYNEQYLLIDALPGIPICWYKFESVKVLVCLSGC